MAKLGFIGLGQMGSAMCPNLIDSGHDLQVFDISKKAADAIGKLGAKVASTPKEAAQGCEFIFTILPFGAIVEDVVFGPDGVSEGMANNALFVEMSTIQPDESRSIGNRLSQKGLSMVDAPVGRTSAHAKNRKSTFMVGGAKDDFERVLPFLECMGEAVTHCGELGSGATVKLVNNYIAAVSNLVNAEGLALGLSAGVSQEIMVEVISKTPAGLGHITTTWPEKALKDDESPAFMLDLARKDIGLALAAGSASKVSLVTGAVAHEMYNLASANGHGQEDWTTGIYRTVKKLSKIK